MEQLFDIECWLPFDGGKYHCTLAAGVNQEYVDQAQAEYEKSLAAWRVAPSAWSMPFHHSLNIVPHIPLQKNKSYVKSEEHNKQIKKAEEKGIEEGKRRITQWARHYITNQQQLRNFERDLKTILK